jgi:hypothetical protein
MLTEAEVRALLAAAVASAGGQRRFAEQHGFTAGYINDVLRGNRNLSDRILRAIGVERIVVYRAIAKEG